MGFLWPQLCSAPSEVKVLDTPAIQLRAVRHAFEADGRQVPALYVEEFTVEAGGRLAIRGPNGSGKTTLLHVIAGLLRPDEGFVAVEGVDPYRLPGWKRDAFRARRIGYLFQALHLLDPLSAFENVLCAASFSGIPRKERRERVDAILERFGLAPRRNHRPPQLSIGQQQRVAAARALVHEPAIVLCDEPTASLDASGARALMRDLDGLCRERGTTLIVASHDPEVLAAFPTWELRALEGLP